VPLALPVNVMVFVESTGTGRASGTPIFSLDAALATVRLVSMQRWRPDEEFVDVGLHVS
jgi:hypothetical protein